jgi:hypothetical protein
VLRRWEIRDLDAEVPAFVGQEKAADLFPGTGASIHDEDRLVSVGVQLDPDLSRWRSTS